MRERVCMCAKERERECVCVCRERERERERERKREENELRWPLARMLPDLIHFVTKCFASLGRPSLGFVAPVAVVIAFADRVTQLHHAIQGRRSHTCD